MHLPPVKLLPLPEAVFLWGEAPKPAGPLPVCVMCHVRVRVCVRHVRVCVYVCF